MTGIQDLTDLNNQFDAVTVYYDYTGLKHQFHA